MSSGTISRAYPAATTTLERVRRACGFSREGLAVEAKLSARTIYAIEVEGNRPHRATQRVIADALGVDPGEIFPSSDVKGPAANPGPDEKRGRRAAGDALPA